MPQSSVLALAENLCNGQVLATDPVMIRFYNEAVIDLAREVALVSIEDVPVSVEETDYLLPATAVKILAVFAAGRQLSPATVRELEAVAGLDWRFAKGDPKAIVREDQSAHAFKIFPAPEDATIPVKVLFTQVRQDAPVWLDLLLALEVLRRVFTVDSAYADPNFAAICQQLTGLLSGLML